MHEFAAKSAWLQLMHSIEKGGTSPREEDAVREDSLGYGGQRAVLYRLGQRLYCTALSALILEAGSSLMHVTQGSA